MNINALKQACFPCSTEPRSVATSTFLCAAIATGVLAGVGAYLLGWGTPSVISLGAVSGGSLVTGIALACHSAALSGQMAYLPSKQHPDMFTQRVELEKPLNFRGEPMGSPLLDDLYHLYKTGNLQLFKETLKNTEQKVIEATCERLHTIDVGIPIKSCLFKGEFIRSCLFELILEEEKGKADLPFFKAIFKTLDEVGIYYSGYAEIQDQELFEQVFSKLGVHAIRSALNNVNTRLMPIETQVRILEILSNKGGEFFSMEEMKGQFEECIYGTACEPAKKADLLNNIYLSI